MFLAWIAKIKQENDYFLVPRKENFVWPGIWSGVTMDGDMVGS